MKHTHTHTRTPCTYLSSWLCLWKPILCLSYFDMVFDDTCLLLSLLISCRLRSTSDSLLFYLLAIRKKFEQASGGNRCEFDEHYAFLIDNDAQVMDICQNGYHCAETSFNVLGNYELRFDCEEHRDGSSTMTEMVAPSLRSSLYSLLPYVRIRVLASLRFPTVETPTLLSVRLI